MGDYEAVETPAEKFAAGEHVPPVPIEVPVEEKEAPPEPQAPPAPVVVAEVDRLKAENINLKLLGNINKETILQHQLNDLQRERQELNAKMAELRREIEVKYGINLTTHHIMPDNGVVVPRMPGVPAGALAALRQARG